MPPGPATATDVPFAPELLVLNSNVGVNSPTGLGILASSRILMTYGTTYFLSNEGVARSSLNANIQFTTIDDLTITAQVCSVDVSVIQGTSDWECTGNLLGDPVVIVGEVIEPNPENGGNSTSPTGGGAGEYIQQFAKSPSMTCDEAQPEGLNWSGAPSGGWGESWAQWPNDGRGGEVCVRTLFYNTSTGKWDVR